jgi:hypothetical protein
VEGGVTLLGGHISWRWDKGWSVISEGKGSGVS